MKYSLSRKFNTVTILGLINVQCSRFDISVYILTTGCDGKNGARCFLTPIGPIPGPPPPCGMQNVLWRLRWHTSAPIQPGLVNPTYTRGNFYQNKVAR